MLWLLTRDFEEKRQQEIKKNHGNYNVFRSPKRIKVPSQKN